MTTADYFRPAFLEQIMRRHAPARNIRVERVRPLALDSSSSILTALTAGCSAKPVGHFGLEVQLLADGQPQTQRLVLKLKPAGHDIATMLSGMAGACGGAVAEIYPHYQALTGFEHTHWRELQAYGQADPSGLLPQVWATHADPSRDTYAVLLEYLDEGRTVELLNSVMAPERWTDAHIRAALTQLAAWHAAHLHPTPTARANYGPDVPSGAFMQRLAPLWTALLSNAASRFPELFTPARAAQLRQAIAHIPAYWQQLEQHPKTLVHNDLNPRNTCFKRDAAGQLRLCAYDWELATYHLPQYDVVELLAFVLDADRYHLRPLYLEHYRQALHALTGQFADAVRFREGFQLAALDFGLHRLGMYFMAHSVCPYPYLPRVANSFFDTIAGLDLNRYGRGYGVQYGLVTY
ncbi:hydroxymethylglutaryl-CoA reductase [Hymenobacter saemangeumensis]|uniref:Hydroxymethylglutaryl-CoA reductase n=1 Tax=Hymenobacter saemangeumensis TaxID=1084522 RepID=A0ABP8IAH5_9BACT